jgi:hypothetical protein
MYVKKSYSLVFVSLCFAWAYLGMLGLAWVCLGYVCKKDHTHTSLSSFDPFQLSHLFNARAVQRRIALLEGTVQRCIH